MPEIAITQVMQFHSDAVEDGDLQITRLEGEEGINRPYEFRLDLASTKPDIDFADVIKKPVWIGIKQGVQLAGQDKRAATTLKIHGVIQSFEQVGKELELVKYRAVVVPKLHRLSLAHQSRIFQEKDIPEIIKSICQEYDVEVDTGKLGSYSKRDYVVQYEESDLDFIHRWMEHEGIFYYFVQEEDREKMVLADSPEGYGAMQGNAKFSYKPAQEDNESRIEAGDTEEAAEDWFKEEVITGIAAKTNLLPKKVVLNDYNWDDPDTSLEAEEEVHGDGVGVVYKYNNHFHSKDDGKRLAKIRAEEIQCREHVFNGRADCRGFRAGMKFEMQDHYRGSMNTEYLITEIKHKATQAVALGSNAGGGASYSNSFTAIPKTKKFRPVFKTKWPQIKGVMHAKVDGADGSTPYAQLDDKGRYKIKMPIDRGGGQDGQSSKYVRKSEPYAGPNQGMHFPLLKNSEVILTHIDGDPDRPVIAGAMFNSKNSSVVGMANPTQNVVATPGGTKLIMDDTVGAPFVKLHTKDEKIKMNFDGTDGSEAVTIGADVSNSYIRMGKAQDEPTPAKISGADGIYISADGDMNTVAGADINMNSGANFNQEVAGNAVIHIVGTKDEKVDGTSDWKVTGRSAAYTYGDWFTFNAAAKIVTSVGATATAQIGVEAKVAYALSASCTRGDGIAATWGASLKYDKSKSFTIGSDVWGLFIKKKIEQKALTAIDLDSAGTVTIEAGTKLTLKCGNSKIELTPAGIKLQNGSSRQTMNASLARLKAASIELKATGSLLAKGTPGGQYK